ncbi:hypothetical protein ACHAWF_012373 [Thalassiosira exigua]
MSMFNNPFSRSNSGRGRRGGRTSPSPAAIVSGTWFNSRSHATTMTSPGTGRAVWGGAGSHGYGHGQGSYGYGAPPPPQDDTPPTARTTPSEGQGDDGDDDRGGCDDPLMYRMRHQRSYAEDKQQRRASRRRSARHRDRLNATDPFDVWGSSTSEDTKRGRRALYGSDDDDDDDDTNSVDVSGWKSQRNSFGRHSDSSDDNEDDDGLFVDFGGVTPQKDRRRRRPGSMPVTPDARDGHAWDADAEDDEGGLFVDFGGVTPDKKPEAVRRRRRISSPGPEPRPIPPPDGEGLCVEFGGITPEKTDPEQRRRLTTRSDTRPHSTLDADEALAMIRSFSSPHGSRRSSEPGRTSRRGDFDPQMNASAPPLLNDAGDGSVPSHYDLENILSSLEDEVMNSNSEPEAVLGRNDRSSPPRLPADDELGGPPGPSTPPASPPGRGGAGYASSCASSLSSPTEKYHELIRQSVVMSTSTPFLPASGQPQAVSASALTMDSPLPSVPHKQPLPMVPLGERQRRQHQQSKQQNQSPTLLSLPVEAGHSAPPCQPSPRSLPQSKPSPSHQGSQRSLTPSLLPKSQPPQSQPQQQVKGSSPPLPSKSHPEQSQPQQQVKEEEDDPRLAQLKLQSTEELRTELPKMQAQSKTNLEKSWAETERMRVENSDFDDQLAKIRQQLAIAQTNLKSLPSDEPEGHRRSPSVNSSNEGSRMSQSNHGAVGDRGFIMTKFCRTRPPAALKSRRRRCTISGPSPIDDDAISDISSEFGLSSRRSPAGWFQSGVAAARQTSGVDINSSGRSSRVGNDRAADTFDNPTSAVDRNDHDGRDRKIGAAGKANRKGFLAELSSSIRGGMGGMSSGNSVASSEFDIGLGFEDDDDSSSSEEGGVPGFDGPTSSSSVPLVPRSIPLSGPLSRSIVTQRSGNLTRSTCYDQDDDSVSGKSGVFYPAPTPSIDSEDKKDDDSVSGKSGVFYPAPTLSIDSEDKKEMSGNCQLSVGELSAMDDFDFDPLNESNDAADPAGKQERRGSLRSTATGGDGKSKERGSGFARRPSFMSLFDVEDGEEDKTTTSLRKETTNSVAAIKTLILERGDETKQIMSSIQKLEKEVQACDDEIARADAEGDDSEDQHLDEESKLQHDVDELKRQDSQTESKLNHTEDLEQRVKDKERALQEELGVLELDDNIPQRKEDEVDFGSQLSYLQEQYSTSQESAIRSLSEILDEFDAMQIPSLRDEIEEDNVSGDIITGFDSLTDLEEELVGRFSDVAFLNSWHMSLCELQRNLELTERWQTEFGALEADFRKTCGAIKELIKREGGDEGTNTTESSTASERLSIERAFVESIVSRLESIKQNRGRLALDSISEMLYFASDWDQLSQAEFVELASDAIARDGNISTFANIISQANIELVSAKKYVSMEQSQFLAKMKGAGIASRSPLDNTGDSRVCDSKSTVDRDASHADSNQAVNSDVKPLNEDLRNEVRRQLSSAETLLNGRESLLKMCSPFLPPIPQARTANSDDAEGEILEEDITHELHKIDKEILTATTVLSERESLFKKYSSELGSVHEQSQEDGNASKTMAKEICNSLSHLSACLTDERGVVASLRQKVQDKRQKVLDLECQIHSQTD